MFPTLGCPLSPTTAGNNFLQPSIVSPPPTPFTSFFVSSYAVLLLSVRLDGFKRHTFLWDLTRMPGIVTAKQLPLMSRDCFQSCRGETLREMRYPFPGRLECTTVSVCYWYKASCRTRNKSGRRGGARRRVLLL